MRISTVNTKVKMEEIATKNLNNDQLTVLNSVDEIYRVDNSLIGYKKGKAIFEESYKFSRKYYTFTKPNFLYNK